MILDSKLMTYLFLEVAPINNPVVIFFRLNNKDIRNKKHPKQFLKSY